MNHRLVRYNSVVDLARVAQGPKELIARLDSPGIPDRNPSTARTIPIRDALARAGSVADIAPRQLGTIIRRFRAPPRHALQKSVVEASGARVGRNGGVSDGATFKVFTF